MNNSIKQQELISVVVPVYNVEFYLPRCLDTIARQTYCNLEIILVDDGSTDRSGIICDTFALRDSRAVVVHQQNRNVCNARNVGISIAHGSYLTFVDSDDYIHLDFINEMYNAFSKDESCDIVIVDFTETDTLDEDIESNGYNNYSVLTQEEIIDTMFCHDSKGSLGYVWNKMYRKTVFDGIRFHNYQIKEDWDLNYRIFLKIKKVVWIHKKLYYYVQRNGSITRSYESQKTSSISFLNILYDNYSNMPKESKGYKHYLIKYFYMEMANLMRSTISIEEQKSVRSQCSQFEKSLRKAYWLDMNICLIEKIAMTANVRYPFFIKWIRKKLSRNISWYMFVKF